MATKYYVNWWKADGTRWGMREPQTRGRVLLKLEKLLRKSRSRPQVTDIKITPIYK